MDETPSLRPGQLIDGKYEIIGLLGSGSMGLVYRAKHKALNRVVALKTLRAEIAMDDELVARFQQEARAAGALGHPNIVQIFDAGQTFSGIHYMVMEQLDGQSLYELMEQTPLLSPERAVAIMGQVLSALAVAHRRGIVHRDLKPENIFLAQTETSDEQVKLLDFGISKILERAEDGIRGADVVTRATKMGVVMGTPLYMSPEQARGEADIDHRADLWSAACVLYEMLCGKTPYDGENYNQVMVAILDDDFELPRRLRAEISPALEAVILRGKAFDRSKRYPDAEAMRKELTAVIGGKSETHVQSFSPEVAPAKPSETVAVGTPPPERIEPPAPAQAARAEQPPARGLESNSALSIAKLDGSMSEDDARMLSALDNLGSATVGTLDDDPAHDEIGLASTMTPVPGSLSAVSPTGPIPDSTFELPDIPDDEPAPGPAAPPPALEPRTREPLDDSAFSAPVAEFESNAVELREDVLREVAPARARAPIRRPPPGTMHRSSGVGIGSILTGLVVLAILGGGGFAAYRYYTLGYVLPRDDQGVSEIAFSIVPANAEVLINNDPLMTRPFEAEAGTEYRITMRAEGRLRVERKLTLQPNQTVTLNVRLPLAVSTIDKATAKSYDVPQSADETADNASYEKIDGALAGIELYAQCLGILAEPVSSSEEAYTKSTRTRLTRNSLPIVIPIDTKLGLECQTLLEVAKDRGRVLGDTPKLAKRYIDAVGELMQLLQSTADYYETEQYKQDRLAKGRKAHAKLKNKFAEVIELQHKLVSRTLGARRKWQMAELAALEQAEGRSTHWYARRLVLASQEWVLSELGNAPKDVRESRRQAFDTAYDDAQNHIRKGPIAGVRMVKPYVSSVGAIAAQKDGESLRWHNDSVILFNKIVITGSPDPQ